MITDDIRQKVKTLLEKNGIDRPPVPVEKVASWLGAKVRYSALDEDMSGMIYIGNDGPIIGVNSRHHRNRQRFTIAHEIGHLELHRGTLVNRVHIDRTFPVLMRDASSATGTRLMEIQANSYAAELLMPSFLLLEMLKEKGIDIDDEEPLNRWSRKFGVSRQALEFRIRNLM